MRKHKGFTLVELVVVVMILGILAAVAMPKLLNTSSAATNNALRQTLATMRDAIERYAAEHGGELPAAGGTDQTAFKNALRMYLRLPGNDIANFPKCPVGQHPDNVVSVVQDDALTADNTTGWLYSSSSGEFIVNSDDGVAGETGVTYNQL